MLHPDTGEICVFDHVNAKIVSSDSETVTLEIENSTCHDRDISVLAETSEHARERSLGWASKYNTINCAASHHFAEGRWLRDGSYLNDYMRFWCSPEGSPRRYSFPISAALLKFYSVHPDDNLLKARICLTRLYRLAVQAEMAGGAVL